MKDQAQIVIIGGGIVGAQIAYHLAKMDRKDIILVEKGEIASGKSSQRQTCNAVRHFAKTMLKFRMYSIELYSELGLFDHVGSLRVGSTAESLYGFERSVSRGKGIGVGM